MQRTVFYYTATSGSEKVFFTNEDLRPPGITNVKKIGQKLLETKYHEISDFPDALALWQFDRSLAGEGPEAVNMEIIGAGTTSKFTPGPVDGRYATAGYIDRSLQAASITASLHLTGSVTYMFLFNSYQDGVPTNDGAARQDLASVRGNNSLNNDANNPLIAFPYGQTSADGIVVFWRDDNGSNVFPTPEPNRMLLNKNWNHVAVTINENGTGCAIYINGAQVLVESGLSPINPNPSNQRPRVLGPATNNIAQTAGAICSFIIIGRELTPSEVYKAAKMTLGDSI